MLEFVVGIAPKDAGKPDVLLESVTGEPTVKPRANEHHTSIMRQPSKDAKDVLLHLNEVIRPENVGIARLNTINTQPFSKISVKGSLDAPT